jgi:hypothetical protein
MISLLSQLLLNQLLLNQLFECDRILERNKEIYVILDKFILK